MTSGMAYFGTEVGSRVPPGIAGRTAALIEGASEWSLTGPAISPAKVPAPSFRNTRLVSMGCVLSFLGSGERKSPIRGSLACRRPLQEGVTFCRSENLPHSTCWAVLLPLCRHAMYGGDKVL